MSQNIRELAARLNYISFYQRAGAWLYFVGSLLFYFGVYYTDSLWGYLFIAVGLVIMLSEPLVLLSVKDSSSSLFSRTILISWFLAVFAIALYLLQFFLEIPTDTLGGTKNSFISHLKTATLNLFILVYVISLLYRLLANLSHSRIAITSLSLKKQQQTNLTRALSSIVTVFLVVVLANYMSYLRNPSFDLSPGYFSFSENSRGVIGSLDQEVQVYAFLPQMQALKLRKGGFTPPEIYKITKKVRLLLEQLPLINSKIKLHFYNADLDTYDVSEFGNITNGSIVLRTLKKESQDFSEAKPYIERRVYFKSERELGRFEKDMVKALLYVASPQKTIYFTSSNGERYDLSGVTSRTRGIEFLKEQLRFYNLKLKKLDHTNNWPGKIAEDADLLAIIGPSVSFGKDARQHIVNYLQEGGALLISIDPQGAEDFSWLLSKLGSASYKLVDKVLTNTNHSGILVSDNFQDHPITESLKSLSQAVVVMLEQAYFGLSKQKEQKSKIDKQSKPKQRPSSKDSSKQDAKQKGKIDQEQEVPLKKQRIENIQELSPKPLLYAPYNAYVDANRNRRSDSDERSKSGRQILALAYEKPGMLGSPKLVIFSGTDWLSEKGIRFPIAHRNSLMVSDSIFWLLESPVTATFVAKEIPSHSIQVNERLKWKLLFFGMFVFPVSVAFLLSIGLFYYRRKRSLKTN